MWIKHQIIRICNGYYLLYILILNSFESYKGFIVNFYRLLHRIMIIESTMALHQFYVFMYSLYFRCPFLDLPGYFGNGRFGRFGWIRQAGSSYNILFWNCWNGQTQTRQTLPLDGFDGFGVKGGQGGKGWQVHWSALLIIALDQSSSRASQRVSLYPLRLR